MADETEEAETYYSRPSLMQLLMRKLMYIFGACVLLWIIAIKYFPELAAPPHTRSGSVTQNGASRRLNAQAAPPAPALPADSALRHSREGAEPVPQVALAEKPAETAPPIPAAAEPADAAALRARIDELEERLKQAGPPASAPAEEQVAKQNEAQDEAISAMKAALGSAQEREEQLQSQIKEQASAIESLKNEIADVRAHGAQKLTAFTAFGFLREAIVRGEPFDSQLRQLATQIEDEPLRNFLTRFAPFAEKGVVTLPALQTEFSAALSAALSPAGKGSFAQNLQSLIRIRKVGEQQQGNDDESILARAEAKLGRDEVLGAMKEIGALSPPAADDFHVWMQHAEAYVQVRRQLDTLQLALFKDRPVGEEKPPARPAPAKAEPAPPKPAPASPPEPKPAPAPKNDAPAAPAGAPDQT